MLHLCLHFEPDLLSGSDVTSYLRLHIHDTQLVLGLYRADRLDACAVLVLLVFAMLNEPEEKTILIPAFSLHRCAQKQRCLDL